MINTGLVLPYTEKEVLNILKITSIDEKKPTGYTNPLLVTCEDGKQYIAKTINDQCNGKELFNEYFASRFAELLHLPIPEYTIGKIGRELSNKNPILLEHNVASGPCFLTRYLKGATGLSPIFLRKATNPQDFASIVLFDQVILNVDRGENLANWFFSRDDNRLIIIDQGNIFRVAQIWDQNSLQQDMTDPPELIRTIHDRPYRILAEYFSKGPNPFSSLARTIKSLSDDQIRSCFNDIPDQWKMSDVEIEAAFDFIIYQRNHVQDIVSQLENTFKTRKGA